jgi:predicted nucleotidyltransferase component of viral defense system
MQDLIKQEQFELEVLDKLNSKRLLVPLVFIGGTMLRLCYGLERYSVDLDFWLAKKTDEKKYFQAIKNCLSSSYTLRDSMNKFNTFLFEIKASDYPRSLKIEIRKEIWTNKTEQAIAFSKNATNQIFITVASLDGILKSKFGALLNREAIRDAFDLEFLVKKGIKLDVPAQELEKALKIINSFGKKDYTVSLGSLLEEEQRRYYTKENFKILKMAITEKLREIR